MDIFLYILSNNIAPMFLLIIVGFLLGRFRKMDVKTLSATIINVLIPGNIIVRLYKADFDISLLKTLIYSLVFIALCAGLGFVISKLRRFSPKKTAVFIESQMFYNSGNFGLPLIILVFSNAPFIVNGEAIYLDYAVAAQTIVMSVQSLLTASGCYAMNGSGNGSFKDAVKRGLKLPIIYVIPLVFLMKAIPYDFTGFFLWPSAEFACDALVAVSLVTVGIQFSNSKLKNFGVDSLLSNLARLVVCPVIAFFLIKLFGISGLLAQVLLISSSVPTALMVALISVECDCESDYVAQTVLSCMLICPITLSVVVYLARILFPIV
ncbi:MAG: AEC family transporter [Ruminococcaceae bacterium]|nr:AEC family transporter [Oscillospiraceae bacterium]